MYLLIEIVISIIISSIPMVLYFKKHKKDKKKLLIAILASLILLVGSLIRTIAIEQYPIGLNQDEASIGYESYSVLNYGIDRNGFSIPVHFVSWGSGQNALYAYLIMPLILLFGNTIFSIRFMMALIGCVTLLIAYFFFKDAFDDKKGLIALLVFSIIPWHILKSRWGLESNVFPDLIFYSLALIYFGIKYKKTKYFIFSSIILGISTYAYGTSYLFVPIFSVIMYIYLIIKKKITIKSSLLYLFITGVISLPMILFVIVNYFNLDSIKILNISIPKLVYNRFTEITSVNGDFINNCFNNIKETILILLKQNDGMILNYSPKYGILYIISFPFIILGIISAIIDKKNILLKLNNIMFVSSIVIAFFTIPNINRVNILWLSLMIYIVAGVLFSFKYIHKYLKIGIISIYLVFFLMFTINYFGAYQNEIGNATFDGLDDAIMFISDKKYDNLYITNSVNQPYVYYLYLNKIHPKYYINNRVFLYEDAMFQTINNVSNVYFFIPNDFKKNNIYIMSNYELFKYNIKDFMIERFNNYSVVYWS